MTLPATPSKDILDWGLFRFGFEDFIANWYDFYNELMSNLRNFDLERTLQSLRQSIEVCKELYKDVTGLSLNKQISLHDIKGNISQLKSLSESKKLFELLNDVKNSIKSVNECILFSGNERDSLIKNYGSFKDQADKFKTDYSEIITSTIKSIQQELRSFADYTLRQDLMSEESVENQSAALYKFMKLIRSRFSRYDWNNLKGEMERLNLSDSSFKHIMDEL